MLVEQFERCRPQFNNVLWAFRQEQLTPLQVQLCMYFCHCLALILTHSVSNFQALNFKSISAILWH